MTTPPEIVAILNWQAAHAGQVPYSETATTRLASDSAHMLSATDCSGMVARMFAHFAGLQVGTWTGNECSCGQLITTSKADAAAGKGMLPGDVVLFNWSGPNPTFDHIAIYAGGGRIWNHGGPGKGPLDWSLADNVNAATNIMARRFIPLSTDPFDELMEQIMSWYPDKATFETAMQARSGKGVLTNKSYKNESGEKAYIWQFITDAHNEIRRLLPELLTEVKALRADVAALKAKK